MEGVIGHTAIEALRQEDYAGAITLWTGGKYLHYDRPKLYLPCVIY